MCDNTVLRPIRAAAVASSRRRGLLHTMTSSEFAMTSATSSAGMRVLKVKNCGLARCFHHVKQSLRHCEEALLATKQYVLAQRLIAFLSLA